MEKSPASLEIGPRNLFDRQGVANLKRLSQADSPEANVAVAQQFEALFVGMLLKSMREASLGEDALFGSSAQQTYQGMFDQQLAVQTADRGVLGISKLMLQQLQDQAGGKGTTIPASTGQLSSVTQLPVSSLTALEKTAELSSLRAAARSAVVADNTPVVEKENPIEQLLPEEFLQQIWPLAVATGKRLGVAPEAIAGQAVLESGWGQKTIRQDDGRSSYNIFGIKAGPGWTGDSVTVSTLEYKHGVAVRERASFRAYDSHAAAFTDYADFLRQRSWYQQALAEGQDTAGFAQGLQQAGYATDPQYANKVTRLAEQIKHQHRPGGHG